MGDEDNNWAPLLQNYLINNVHGDTTIYNACEYAAIIGEDGTAWAATEGFEFNTANKIKVNKEDGSTEEVTVNEFEHLKDAIAHRGDTGKMKKGGVHFLGHKWITLDGFQVEEYFTQYFKRNGGGCAVTMCDTGRIVMGTWNAEKKAITLKGDVQKDVKQSVGFCNNAVDDLSKVIAAMPL